MCPELLVPLSIVFLHFTFISGLIYSNKWSLFCTDATEESDGCIPLNLLSSLVVSMWSEAV